MPACHSLSLHSPLKSVLNKIADSYQTYCNTYKTHAMANHHRDAGQPSDRDHNLPEKDTDIPSDILEDIDNFKNVEHENHTTLKALTRNLADLWHRIENAEGQPMEDIHCLEHEFHRLSLTLQPSAPPRTPGWSIATIHGDPMFCPETNHFHKHSKIYPPSMGVIWHN